MLLLNEREFLVEYGKKLIDKNLTKGTSGNLSIFNREKELFAITPSGIDYYETRIEDIVIMNLNGNVVEGNKKPSSDYNLHRIFYVNRDDINAIVHAHTVYSTVLSCLKMSLPAVHYMIASAGKDVRCAEYATFGTEELAKNAYDAMRDRKAVLLANHGVLTAGKDIFEAFSILEDVEYVSELYIKAKNLGEPVIIDDKEMGKIIEKFKSYGQK
ncbi:L-fuculose-phosphate aldolase [Soehngenia longivitae]|uniref:L-fuculose-phosphate aldolase n=1 Tax=Soehngenia longivitae TaxID=2562294 RepID=A0A4Z0D872_9FIRM|nr:L-fuculose-phosphate aldolase [Soehngenia longivitae]TFZ41076.1 L-fuculose-phosphate aldolase [Soehngenia longivitae]